MPVPELMLKRFSVLVMFSIAGIVGITNAALLRKQRKVIFATLIIALIVFVRFQCFSFIFVAEGYQDDDSLVRELTEFTADVQAAPGSYTARWSGSRLKGYAYVGNSEITPLIVPIAVPALLIATTLWLRRRKDFA